MTAAEPDPLEITTTSLPGGEVGEAYAATLEATGGTEPYTWDVIAGSLPPGLSLDAATGEIAGTPTDAGSFTFTVEVTDSGDPAQSDSAELTIEVTEEPTLEVFVQDSFNRADTTSGWGEADIGGTWAHTLSHGSDGSSMATISNNRGTVAPTTAPRLNVAGGVLE